MRVASQANVCGVNEGGVVERSEAKVVDSVDVGLLGYQVPAEQRV